MIDPGISELHANTTPFAAKSSSFRTTMEDAPRPRLSEKTAPQPRVAFQPPLLPPTYESGGNNEQRRSSGVVGGAGTSDEQLSDTLWEQTHVELLQTWKGHAFVHLWMQAASMYLYRRLYTCFSFPILIISTITGTIVYAENRLTKYVISALSLIMAILSSLQRQIRPSERAAEHLSIVQKYNVIIRNINTTISLPEDQRPEPGIFIQNIKQQLDNLVNSQPEPLEIVITFFNRRFKVSVEKALYGDSLQELLERDHKISEALTVVQRQASMMLRRPFSRPTLPSNAVVGPSYYNSPTRAKITPAEESQQSNV